MKAAVSLRKLLDGERRLVACNYHRNGNSDEGFHVILFDWKDSRVEAPRHMLAVVFEGPGRCAVLDLTETVAGNIAFGNGNNWRGNRFEEDCRKWVLEEEKER